MSELNLILYKCFVYHSASWLFFRDIICNKFPEILISDLTLTEACRSSLPTPEYPHIMISWKPTFCYYFRSSLPIYWASHIFRPLSKYPWYFPRTAVQISGIMTIVYVSQTIQRIRIKWGTGSWILCVRIPDASVSDSFPKTGFPILLQIFTSEPSIPAKCALLGWCAVNHDKATILKIKL